jgi:hypothetical protein
MLSEIDRTGGGGDPLQEDPEVRQARSTAEAARSRLAACVVGPQVDLAEAQRMLDALRRAEALAADAEDRVLVRNGLLTSADADSRAAARQPAPAAASAVRAAPAADDAPSAGGALVIPFRTVRLPVPVLPPLSAGARRTAVRAARVLLPAAAGLAGAVVARRLLRARRDADLKD